MPRLSPAPASPPSTGSRLVWAGLGLTILLYLAAAAYHVACGAMNVDEGFYAAAARAVWAGEVPYRDFGFTQTPLVSYANGLVMGLTRFGLFEQRIINGCWGLLALLLGVRLLWRRGQGWGAVLLLGLFALSAAWLYLTHLGKTYALVSLIIMAAVSVWLEWEPGWKKTSVLSLLAVIGIGCRLPTAPFFAVLCLAALWDGGGPDRNRLAVAGASLVVATAALLLPFYLLAPDQVRFWIWDFHMVSVPLRDWRVRWEEIVALAPGVWGLLALVVVAGLVARRRWPWRESVTAAAALAGLAANLVPKGAYEEYGVPLLPPLAVAVLLLASPAVADWRPAWRWLGALVLLLLPLLLIPWLCGPYRGKNKQSFPSILLPLNTRPYNHELPANIRRGRELVTRVLPAGHPFHGPAIILAVEADRPVPRRLRMGAFTMTSDFSEAEADRLHLMTYGELTRQVLAGEVRVFGLHAESFFNYAWSVPSFSFQTDAERARMGRVFGPRFATASQDRDFVVLVARP